MKNANVGSFATAKLQVIIAIAMITVIGFSFAACEVPKEKGGEDAQFVVFYLDNNYEPTDTDMGTTAYVYVDESLPHSIIMTSGNDGFVWIVASDGNTSNGARVYFKNGAVFPEHFIIAENGVTVAGATLSYNEQAGKFTAVFYQDGESETLNNITLNKNTLYAGQDVRTRNAANALLVLQTINGQIPHNTRAASVGFWDRQIYHYFSVWGQLIPNLVNSEFFRNLAERLFEDEEWELREFGTDTTNVRMGLIREMDKSAIKKLKKEKDQVEGIAAIIDDANNGNPDNGDPNNGSSGIDNPDNGGPVVTVTVKAKNVTARATSSGQGSSLSPKGFIEVSWDIAADQQDLQQGIKYNIYRATSETGIENRIHSLIAKNQSASYVDGIDPVSLSTTYYYKVYEVNGVDQEEKHVGTVSAKPLQLLFVPGTVVSISDGTSITIYDSGAWLDTEGSVAWRAGTINYNGAYGNREGEWFYYPSKSIFLFNRYQGGMSYYTGTLSGNSITILQSYDYDPRYYW